MRKIERELRREFPEAEIEVARGTSHFKIRLANGRVVTTSSTPSCPFFWRNVRRDVRRAIEEQE